MLRGILLFSISHVMRYETASLYATTACHLLYHCLSKMLWLLFKTLRLQFL